MAREHKLVLKQCGILKMDYLDVEKYCMVNN